MPRFTSSVRRQLPPAAALIFGLSVAHAREPQPQQQPASAPLETFLLVKGLKGQVRNYSGPYNSNSIAGAGGEAFLVRYTNSSPANSADKQYSFAVGKGGRVYSTDAHDILDNMQRAAHSLGSVNCDGRAPNGQEVIVTVVGERAAAWQQAKTIGGYYLPGRGSLSCNDGPQTPMEPYPALL